MVACARVARSIRGPAKRVYLAVPGMLWPLPGGACDNSPPNRCTGTGTVKQEGSGARGWFKKAAASATGPSGAPASGSSRAEAKKLVKKLADPGVGREGCLWLIGVKYIWDLCAKLLVWPGHFFKLRHHPKVTRNSSHMLDVAQPRSPPPPLPRRTTCRGGAGQGRGWPSLGLWEETAAKGGGRGGTGSGRSAGEAWRGRAGGCQTRGGTVPGWFPGFLQQEGLRRICGKAVQNGGSGPPGVLNWPPDEPSWMSGGPSTSSLKPSMYGIMNCDASVARIGRASLLNVTHQSQGVDPTQAYHGGCPAVLCRHSP